jgi:hypothetical protein
MQLTETRRESQASYAYPPANQTKHFSRLRMCTTRIGIPSPRRWQHARGLRLELAFFRPGVGNTLGGCTSNWHSFAPALVTRSGASPRIDIYSPGVGNTLGGFASH